MNSILASNSNAYDVLAFSAAVWDGLLQGYFKHILGSLEPRQGGTSKSGKGKPTRSGRGGSNVALKTTVEPPRLVAELPRISVEALEESTRKEQLNALEKDLDRFGPKFVKESLREIIQLAEQLFGVERDGEEMATLAWLVFFQMRSNIESSGDQWRSILRNCDVILDRGLETARTIEGSVSGVERFRQLLSSFKSTLPNVGDYDTETRPVKELVALYNQSLKRGDFRNVRGADGTPYLEVKAGSRLFSISAGGVLSGGPVLRPGSAVVRGFEHQLMASIVVPMLIIGLIIAVVARWDVTLVIPFVILLMWGVGRCLPSRSD